ncbi:AEC family transporter [Desertibacillus haloalkaliphilus]|uniref:AEC family transporter n=1 Tax=Desertibacillus haloalkaliphilus TaxID=1328930 RepID=UPI001C251916|nr:AEC family transporter [Desertibacillus haloalkaliphilus]MBU8908918.1 AEC family transporter [Desertibacillus haloalkaliphilus]
MNLFFVILTSVILPVFVLLAMGIILHRKFHFDLKTLSKITTYYLLPTTTFVNVYKSNIDGQVLVEVISYQLVLCLILMIICAVASRLLKLDKGMSATLKNSVVLMNSANYGLPVSQLVFQQNPLGMTIQIIVTIIQNFVTYTYGLLNSVSVNYHGRQALQVLFKMPMLYALIAGVLLQTLSVEIPIVLWNPLESVANAFIAMALLVLGAQVAYIQMTKINKILVLSCIGRLVLAPTIALALIFLFGLEGTVAQALFIASSFPSSRNSAQFALEFNNNPELAAQTVLVTTLLSAITVTTVVFIAQLIF